MKVLHFSDPHIQLPRWRERWHRLDPLRAIACVELWRGRGALYDDALDVLRAIVRDADRQRADIVVCTGDLTQLALSEEFALAREALQPVWSRLVCIPGNHDRYPNGLIANRSYEEVFARDLPAPRPGFFLLDSCGPICWPVITRGHLGDLAPLRDWLSTNRGLVLVHHAPLRQSGKPDFPWHSLARARDLLSLCADRAEILCGHLHERYRLPGMICAGSSTERGNRGYWLYSLDDGHVTSAELIALQ